MNKFIGHPAQIYGVEEYRLQGGRGDGMHMLNVRNGKGLDFWISASRAADISRITFNGANCGYFAPCGYVAPEHYDKDGLGFLKSFTAGFITTCGLSAVGAPCEDDGESLGLHGTISNTPCENIGHWIADDGIHIKAIIRDAAIFARKLILEREYVVSLDKNEIKMTDKVKNIGSSDSPYQILYHCNMGYPLLDVDSEITIPAKKIIPQNDHAATGLDVCHKCEQPQADYSEMCFYHEMEGEASAEIYSPKVNKGLKMEYNADLLPYFTQWKMMGEYDYVMGFEPANCLPEGRAKMREKGILKTLKAGEETQHTITFKFFER